jgi:hypothetical protein
MNLRDIKIVLKDSNYADILTAVERKRAQVPFSIALFHNLIFIDAGYQCKSGFKDRNKNNGHPIRMAIDYQALTLFCVEQVLEISNGFIDGYKAVIGFAINPSTRIR